jgi:hypothetical protein
MTTEINYVPQEKVKPGQIYEIRSDGRWNIYLDASMASSFGICNQLFQYTYVRHLQAKGDRPWARDLGSWWSSVMESIYYEQFKDHFLEPKEIIDFATVKWNELRMNELEALHPKMWKEFGGQYGALAMIAEYATRQLPIDYKTWKIIAAEAAFGRNREVCIGETDKVVLYWMGQPDLFVIFNDRIMPVDHKSLSQIDNFTQRKYKPHIQIPGYIIAGQILLRSLGYDLPCDRAIINAVARKDTTTKDGEDIKKPRFKRFFIPYTEAELVEWSRLRLRQAELIRESFERSLWLRNENACSYMWGKSCAFQNIDEKPPETREVVIKADYIQRAPWIPGMTKGEKDAA